MSFVHLGALGNAAASAGWSILEEGVDVGSRWEVVVMMVVVEGWTAIKTVASKTSSIGGIEWSCSLRRASSGCARMSLWSTA